MSMVVSPGSVEEALGMLRSALVYLATADASAMTAGEQARCLRMLEQANSMATAARTSVLGAFTAGQGYSADADYSPRAWLMHKLGITKGAAVAYTAWVKRAADHHGVDQALTTGDISESYAKTLCQWTDRLPQECREGAEEILVAAAVGGLGLRDLAGLFGEIYERSRPQDPDKDPGAAFEDRGVRLETTFGGAGVLNGDLTPECTVLIRAVLDALSAPAGAEDDRTQAQRCHDALAEAMRRLAASGLLPERAGQPVKAWVHIPLAKLLAMPGSTVLMKQWAAGARAAWAAHRAEASAGGGDIGAWLDGQAAAAVTCDAAMAPVVTGEVNPAALEDLVQLCVRLDRLRHGAPGHDGAPRAQADAGAGPAAPGPGGTLGWAAIEQAIIGAAVDLLSGPGGLASFLRRRQLGARLGGPSLPLDIGYAETIPAGIRNAVILRDRHCRWAGGCDQPASACEVHHVTHKANGGTTSVAGCVLLCTFHHQVMIHRQGWTLVLNPDGTTAAWNKDRTKILHSHGPPARPG
jgi:Domain of unknown function (DUF222)